MITIRVKPDAGDGYTVEVESRDVLAWEKSGRDRSMSQLAEPSMTDLYALSYQAARRLGLFTGSLADFETQVDIDPDVGEIDVDPTRPGRSAGNSSPSPSRPASPRRSGQRKATGR